MNSAGEASRSLSRAIRPDLEVKMSKEELIERLEEQAKRPHMETPEAHGEADNLLLDFINDAEVTKAFKKVRKWYE